MGHNLCHPRKLYGTDYKVLILNWCVVLEWGWMLGLNFVVKVAFEKALDGVEF